MSQNDASLKMKEQLTQMRILLNRFDHFDKQFRISEPGESVPHMRQMTAAISDVADCLKECTHQINRLAFYTGLRGENELFRFEKVKKIDR